MRVIHKKPQAIKKDFFQTGFNPRPKPHAKKKKTFLGPQWGFGGAALYTKT
jgi:hypothetical protein